MHIIPILILFTISSSYQCFFAYTGVGLHTADITLDELTCINKHVNYFNNSFIIIPLISNGNAMQTARNAKAAGFQQIHFLVDPNVFKTTSPQAFVTALLDIIVPLGIVPSGVWLRVK